jgi:hypothetical protein
MIKRYLFFNLQNREKKKVKYVKDSMTLWNEYCFLFIYYQFDIFIKDKLYWISFMWPQLNSWFCLASFLSLSVWVYNKSIYANDHLFIKKSISFFESYIYFIVSISLVHVHTSKVEFKVRFLFYLLYHRHRISYYDKRWIVTGLCVG